MKKIIVASVLAVGCYAGMAYAGLEAGTGVNGSLHDMNVVVPGYGDSMDRVCVFCHTPHNATKDDMGVNNYPLWNHNLANPAAFTPYAWATPANAGDGLGWDNTIVDPLIGPSRLCMSCHDGTIAVDQHNGALAQPGNPTTIDTINLGRANLGQDLTNDHPIGFDYVATRTARNVAGLNVDDATGDAEVVDPAAGFATAVAISAVPGTYNTVTRDAGKTIGSVLYQGNIMTCASCHEVHNKENAVQDAWNAVNPVGGAQVTTAPNYFLYAKQTDSLICLSCHVK